MDKLKTFLLSFLLLTGLWSYHASAGGSDSFTVDWVNQLLEVTGTGHIIQRERGNSIQWQHEAAKKAKADMIKNYIIKQIFRCGLCILD